MSLSLRVSNETSEFYRIGGTSNPWLTVEDKILVLKESKGKEVVYNYRKSKKDRPSGKIERKTEETPKR